MPAVRKLGAVLAGAGLLAILLLTLIPSPRRAGVAALTPLPCLVCGESGGADVVLNLLLFVPMGAGLALLGWSWGRIVAVCAMLSLAIETAQYFLVTGRDASLSDVLTNTAGGALGAAIAQRLRLLLAPGPVLARRLSLAAAVAWLGLLVFTAASMQPWAPAGRLRNYCTASYPTAEVFSGTAQTMTLNGVPLSCDQDVPHSDAVRRELRQGEVALQTVAGTGNPDRGPRVIHLVRTPGANLVVLAQHGRAAVFHAPTAARAVRLFAPVVRLSRAFPSREGELVELDAEADGRRLRLSAVHDGGRRAVELPLSPMLRLLAGLWLSALILPAAYWAGLAAQPVGAIGALGAVVTAGLGLVPTLAGLDAVHWSEWLGAAAGVALGWALSRIAAYLQSRCGSPSTSAYSSS
jgi:hypothetical protein